MADVISYKDLNDPSYTIGVENGTIDGPVTEKRLPKAGLSYFSTLVDMVTALEAGKSTLLRCINQIAPKMAHRIRHAIEELVQHILLPNLSDPKINVIVEYSEIDEKTVVSVRYNGPEFEPSVSDDKLAWAILQQSVTDLRYTPISEGVYTNLVTIEQMVNH